MRRLIESIGIALTNLGWLTFHVLALILFNPFERKGYYTKNNHETTNTKTHV